MVGNIFLHEDFYNGVNVQVSAK